MRWLLSAELLSNAYLNAFFIADEISPSSLVASSLVLVSYTTYSTFLNALSSHHIATSVLDSDILHYSNTRYEVLD